MMDWYDITKVEEGVDPSRGKDTCADANTFEQRKSDGPSNGSLEINTDTSKIVKSSKLRKNRTKENKSDSLSDIDDAEIFGYLNNKEEMHYKRIIWEAMNGNYKKVKKQRRAETKKVVPAERASKTTEKVELQRRSSRINYNALEILNNELTQGSETAQSISEDSCRNRNSPQESIGHGMHGSEESYDGEDRHKISCFKDNQSFGYHDSEIENERGDEVVDDECFDF